MYRPIEQTRQWIHQFLSWKARICQAHLEIEVLSIEG